MRIVGSTLALVLFAGCASTPPPSPRAAQLVGETDAEDLYAVDWPTSMRADLEATARRGLVVVEHRSGRALRVLASCTADGAYRTEPVSPKEDLVRFATRQELAAKLPFAGAGLAGQVGVDASDERVVDLVVITRARASAPALPTGRADLPGDCDGATHVVSSFQRGAFAMAARSSRDAATSAGVLGLVAAASTKSSALVARSDGDPAACARDANAPCDALVKVAVRPLASTSALTDPTTATSRLRAPCKGEECITSCEQGVMDACASASVALMESDERRAERYGRVACDAGNGHGCTSLAMLYDPVKATTGRRQGLLDRDRAVKLYARGCELGSLTGCSLLAYYAQKKEPFRPEEEPLAKLVARGCDAGDPQCCFVVAGFYQAKAQHVAKTEIAGSIAAFDEALRYEERYCKVATATDLAKHPCRLDNWREVQEQMRRFRR
jgi:hypothetical protein